MAESPKTYERCEVTLVRVLDAPREAVFRAWTDPEHLAKWWGPKGFTAPLCEADARPGGRIRILMRAPDGSDHPMSGEFIEVVPPERVSWIAWPEDLEGFRYAETHTRVTFEEEPGGKTRMTLNSRAVAFIPMGEEMERGMNQGWAESLARLGELVEAKA